MSLSRQNDPFAVSTPQPHPAAANLSPQERRIYEFLWNHRERTPSMGVLLASIVPRWLFIGGVLAVATISLYLVEAAFDRFGGGSDDFDAKPYFIAAGFGVMTGILLRDYGYCKNLRTLWPIEAAVIDFAKVERLLWGESAQVADREEPLAAIPVEDPRPTGLAGDERR